MPKPQEMHSKYKKSSYLWSPKELSEFYSLLEFFGTDFSLMSPFLKSKSLTQIKVSKILFQIKNENTYYPLHLKLIDFFCLEKI